jgi:hypothetical protein
MIVGVINQLTEDRDKFADLASVRLYREAMLLGENKALQLRVDALRRRCVELEQQLEEVHK